MNIQKNKFFKKLFVMPLSRVSHLIILTLILTPNVVLCEQYHLSNSWGPLQASSSYSAQTVQLLVYHKIRQVKSPINRELKIAFNGRNGSDRNLKLFSPPPPADPAVPRIAILLPLTGQHKKLGQAMLNAAQLALFHFADTQFELLPKDTRGTERGAQDAIALAIGDGASLILGPLLAGSVAAVAPAARAAGVKVIAFSNDQRIAGDGVFTMGFLPREQVRRVVTYAVTQGRHRFAVLAPNNDYGFAIVSALEQVTAEMGVNVVEQAFYDPQTSDFGPVIKKLANYDERREELLEQRRLLEERDDDAAKLALKKLENLETKGNVSFEALLIADGGKTLQAIAALLPYYDIDRNKIKMLGTGHWDLPGIGSEPALVGGWFAAPSADGRHEFENQYSSVFGVTAPRLATLAYDATALAAVFAQTDKRASEEILKSPHTVSKLLARRGFKGLDGIFRFTAMGFVERGLSVFQVGERNNKIISSSPQIFEDDPK
jgi:ABC-type branched-subunit amino acid transport system substrate-binding protein